MFDGPQGMPEAKSTGITKFTFGYSNRTSGARQTRTATLAISSSIPLFMKRTARAQMKTTNGMLCFTEIYHKSTILISLYPGTIVITTTFVKGINVSLPGLNTFLLVSVLRMIRNRHSWARRGIVLFLETPAIERKGRRKMRRSKSLALQVR